MTRATLVETRVLESWQNFQEALKRAIAPLTDEQMNRRLIPGRRSPGEIAVHIVYGRAFWLHQALGEKATELEPLLQWDKPGDLPHSVAAVLDGLDLTWQLITETLTRGSAADNVPAEEVPILRTIWGLLDHDLPHGGQLSLLLRADGLPGVEL